MRGLSCSAQCEHLRSFREGFDGRRMLAPYNGSDRLAVCALEPEKKLYMRSQPSCWRAEEEE
jgi:hypothetical protein